MGESDGTLKFTKPALLAHCLENLKDGDGLILSFPIAPYSAHIQKRVVDSSVEYTVNYGGRPEKTFSNLEALGSYIENLEKLYSPKFPSLVR